MMMGNRKGSKGSYDKIRSDANIQCDVCLVCSSSRIRSSLIKAALILITAHADVSGLTPAGSPGVLDFPVVLSSVSSVSNKQHTVIEVSAASAAEHTRGVVLKAILIGFNGDRDRLAVNGSTQGILVGLDISVAREFGVGRSLAARRFAGAVLTDVRISSLSAETVGLAVSEGAIHQSTVATEVSVLASAVNQLLLRQGDEILGTDCDDTFHGAGSGEGPAGTALTLVLDTSDDIVSRRVVGASPVERTTGIGTRANLDIVEGLRFGEVIMDEAIDVEGLELRGGQVRELVDGHGVGFASSVVKLNGINPVLEGLEFAEEFLRLIGFLVLDHPVDKLFLILFIGFGWSSSGKASKSNKGNGEFLHVV